MNGKKLCASIALSAVGSVFLNGCGPDEVLPAVPATGFLNLALTDGPVDSAQKVCVEFMAAEFKHSDDSIPNRTVEFDPPVQIDLLALQGTNSAPLILSEEMEAGRYNWVRLDVNASRDMPAMSDDGGPGTECQAGGSYIKLESNAVHNLYVPSSDVSMLKLNRGFVLPAGGNASFTIDFDLRKSITAPPGQSPDYKLRPSLRMVDNANVGSLQGTVDSQLVSASGCNGEPAVYVFSGDVVPDDYDGDDGDAITSARVVSEDGGVTYQYEVGFLPEGAHTAAFTCNEDLPDQDDDTTVVSFEPAEGIAFEVIPNDTVTVDFSSPAP